MNLQRLLLSGVLLLAVPAINGMEQQESRQEKEQYHRIPDYCYFQPHPESRISGNAFWRECLQVNSFIFSNKLLQSTYAKLYELINYVCALYVAQATLFNKANRRLDGRRYSEIKCTYY